jgi:hypothetical protein
MILRRRDDTFERVISEHLGGALFATEHPMDKWFERELNDAQKEKPHLVSSEDRRALLPQAIHDDGRKSETNDQENRTREIPRDGSGTSQSIAERAMKEREEDAHTLRLIRITERIQDHIFHASDREAVALRAANLYLTRR